MTDDLRASPEFQAYLRARDAVLRMKQGGGAASPISPSVYWSEELENIDYMIDATPLIVRKLRQHAFHITNVRPYDYRNKNDGRREFFEARLQALRSLCGDSLLVPESTAMGGFGYRIGTELFNIDTIKFYEVLIGMERGGVMKAVRGLERPLVCEIGAGWGGFAYQFKKLAPRATYVLVDFPELFLFSATYLGFTFPDAKLLFVGTDGQMTIDGWRDADFVFVPHTLSRLVSTLPLDLTVNMVSFQEMTDTQVRSYAAMAAAAGCPLLYSLNRERSLYNAELVSVSEALADYYTLGEVPVLDTDYTSAMKKPPKAGRVVDPGEPRYRHLVGRLDPAARQAARSAAAGATVGAGRQPLTSAGPRVVLGMTLHNNARHLPHALESLLAQTHGDFAMVLLDDASSDDTEQVAARYVERDVRLRYFKHAERKAMVATWREAAEIAARAWPSAEYFAWVSDHDWWHPRWLERMMAELDADPGAVLAYPITRRVSLSGDEIDKGPRLFDTAAFTDLHDRWKHFCHEGVGAGDMVYGLMRMDALRCAGIFRPVLRPDRLLVVELTLQGRIRQVPEVLWFRRQSAGTSVERQRTTLMLPGAEPRWFYWPPWLQHSLVLWREYATRPEPATPADGVARPERAKPAAGGSPERAQRVEGLTRAQWVRMILRYQYTYGWRHFRKTGTSHALGRGVENVVWTKKIARHHYHHAVYNTLVGARKLRGRLKRAGRRALYEVLMLTHRLGLRGRGDTPPV